jgi:acyl-CoA thioester hydrolase
VRRRVCRRRAGLVTLVFGGAPPGATLSDNDPLSLYPVVIELPVQWGDEDAFGHVNNTVYLRWCESARVIYLQRVGLWQSERKDAVGPILANISCDFKRAVTFPDTVRIGARVVRIGNSSLQMDHVIVSEAAGAVAATAESTIVAFDYHRKETTRLPDEIRDAIARLEHGALAPCGTPGS